MKRVLRAIKHGLKMLLTDPNSPEGLRMRAERLERKYGVCPWSVTLRKMAAMKEEETKKC